MEYGLGLSQPFTPMHNNTPLYHAPYLFRLVGIGLTTHNIIQIHNNVLWDGQIYVEYSFI